MKISQSKLNSTRVYDLLIHIRFAQLNIIFCINIMNIYLQKTKIYNFQVVFHLNECYCRVSEIEKIHLQRHKIP
jgi:hypothetical protein